MKKHDKIMFGLTKKISMGLLIGIVNTSNHTKGVSSINQKYMIEPTLINFHPNEYSQVFHYYLFSVKLDSYDGSCNTLYDLSNKPCATNKTEDINLSVCNKITEINESKILKKYISCECKCRFDERKCNSDQCWHNKKCLCECKKRHVCERDYIWNTAACNFENGKYLAGFMDDSAITCEEIVDLYKEKIKTISTNFNEKKETCKMQNFYLLPAFLLITTALLISVSIYCYLIKHHAKQKQLL